MNVFMGEKKRKQERGGQTERILREKKHGFTQVNKLNYRWLIKGRAVGHLPNLHKERSCVDVGILTLGLTSSGKREGEGQVLGQAEEEETMRRR